MNVLRHGQFKNTRSHPLAELKIYSKKWSNGRDFAELAYSKMVYYGH